jgi:AcrR family transcriptional regulator
MIDEKTAVSTRTRILDISRDLFTAHGYGGTSIAQIAEKLGTSKAALYYHFKSKEDILDALLSEPFEAMKDFRDSCSRPGVTAEQILGGFIDAMAGPASCLAAFETDPSVVQEWADRNHLHEEWDKLVSCLAGPRPSQGKIISARAALAAAKQGTKTALELNNGKLSKSARADILAAALRTLG